MTATNEDDNSKKYSGHNAVSPLHIPPAGWWSIVKRVYSHIQKDNLSLISAGVAFYFLLAVFPIISALISIYGLVVSVDELGRHMAYLVDILPSDSRYVIQDQIEKIVAKSDVTLGVSLVFSVILAIWSGGKGAQALITACNITYTEGQTRGFFAQIFLRLVMTTSVVLIVGLTLFIITGLPSLLEHTINLTLPDIVVKLWTWLALMVIFNLSLASLYRYAPHRKNAKWRWVTLGSLLSTVLWVAFSFSFSYYLSHFANYNETYGSVGGIIILLMWFYLSAFIILLGAEFNASVEQQTNRDSTVGEEQPQGSRGAYVADNPVGQQQNNKNGAESLTKKVDDK